MVQGAAVWLPTLATAMRHLTMFPGTQGPAVEGLQLASQAP